MVEKARKTKKRQKKTTEKIEQLRTFVIVHSQGKETIFAETVTGACSQGNEILAKKGLSPKRDKMDFYEVKE